MTFPRVVFNVSMRFVPKGKHRNVMLGGKVINHRVAILPVFELLDPIVRDRGIAHEGGIVNERHDVPVG